MPNLPIEKILRELRQEHSNLCAAIAALEALAASHQPARRLSRRTQQIDASWVDAARSASRRLAAPNEPAVVIGE